jgi:predicted nucleic acid-binding protein
MGGRRFLLDSNVLIDALNGRINLLAFLSSFPDCEVYINLIVEIEVLSKTGMSVREEADIRMLLNSFKWAEIDKPVRETVIQIRKSKSLRLPDAIIAATSIAIGATVLSNDSHLRDYGYPDYSAVPVP